MNLFKRPRKVKFPAHEGSQTYAQNRRPTATLAPGQKPTIPGQRSADQRAADYLNAIPDVDDEQWDPMPAPATTRMDVWDLERSLKQKTADEAEPTMWIPVIKPRPEYPPKDDWNGGRRIRAEILKRNGFWISVVRGSDGWPVLYDDVSATPAQGNPDHDGWALMMQSALEDMATVHRVEQAGHRLPEYRHLSHY